MPCCLVAVNPSGEIDLPDSRTTSPSRVALVSLALTSPMSPSHVFCSESRHTTSHKGCQAPPRPSLTLPGSTNAVHTCSHTDVHKHTPSAGTPRRPAQQLLHVRPSMHYLDIPRQPYSPSRYMVTQPFPRLPTRSVRCLPWMPSICTCAPIFSTHGSARCADVTFVEPRHRQRDDRAFIATWWPAYAR